MLEKLVENYMSELQNINKSGPFAKHFNEICPSIDFLTITPIEHVQMKIPDMFMGLLDTIDILALLQTWIKTSIKNLTCLPHLD